MITPRMLALGMGLCLVACSSDSTRRATPAAASSAGVTSAGASAPSSATAAGSGSAGVALTTSAPSGQWSPVTLSSAPSPRSSHSATWTGREMIVLGGVDGGTLVQDAGAYDPARDRWRSLSPQGAPAGRFGHTAVWTGSELLVWGGSDMARSLGDGAAYDPTTDSWRPLPTANGPGARTNHVAVWTGSRMLVWGGSGPGGLGIYSVLSDGAAYDPRTDRWTPIPAQVASVGRSSGVGLWTGSRLLVWGGHTEQEYWTSSGAEYDPQRGTWSPLPRAHTPRAARTGYDVAWTGTSLLIAGGTLTGPNQIPEYRAADHYDAQRRSWTQVPTPGPLLEAANLTATWTGGELLLFGGSGYSGLSGGYGLDVARYAWRRLPDVGAPARRERHTAVWTGSELIVWGGSGANLQALNSGGRFAP